MAALDHAPPPFFKRGPAPLALLSFYVAFAVALFVLDLRFHALDALRQAISLGVDPLQRLAQAPLRMLAEGSEYFVALETLENENRALKAAQLEAAPDLLRLAQLEAENERLRRLLDLQARDKAVGRAARILYTARDPFSRRVYLDKGQQQNLVPGQPVIDEKGIVGQVTRVFPFSAEVTLITDKQQAVPVQILRTGQRSVVFGLGNGQVELKYIPANADVQVGDLLVTSGLDGIYLPGFPVAQVAHVERDSAYAFARIVATPTAAVEHHGVVMVLDPHPPQAPHPEPLPEKSGQKTKSAASTRKH
ncbi:MAG: rod shape-determining protein MreC [Azovibrio sp.]|nr:rod shape-determining protein MreC [Azovibrio sp.]